MIALLGCTQDNVIFLRGGQFRQTSNRLTPREADILYYFPPDSATKKHPMSKTALRMETDKEVITDFLVSLITF